MPIPLPDSLVISLHVPKTAGTAFADVLVANHGDAVAFCYGAGHPKTHPLLRDLPKGPIAAATLTALQDEGIRILHGHFSARRYVDAIPDPTRYWMWLRDPVERVISEYFFNSNRQDPDSPLVARIRDENLSLVDYAEIRATRNLHSLVLGPLDITDIGFVGISEFFDESLALTGLQPLPKDTRLRNVTRNKSRIDLDTRRTIARYNLRDMALYSAALQRVMTDRRAAAG